jgi:hypothetical protein
MLKRPFLTLQLANILPEQLFLVIADTYCDKEGAVLSLVLKCPQVVPGAFFCTCVCATRKSIPWK